MANKILIVETTSFHSLPEIWPEAKKIGAMQGTEPITEALRAEGNTIDLVIAPNDLRGAACFKAALNEENSKASIAYFTNSEQFKANAKVLEFFTNPERATGIKSFLEKGSTIFAEAFFHAGGIGSRLDPCFNFAHSKLTSKRAVDVWAAMQSLVYLGIKSLPDEGEKGTGERVDIQIGADAERFVASVRFDYPSSDIEFLRSSSLFELMRSSCDFFEIRSFQKVNKIEIVGLVLRNSKSALGIELHSARPIAALENGEKVNGYEFKDFHYLKGTAPEDKRVVKGGFRKKFSEELSSIAGDGPTKEEKTKISGDPAASAESAVIKGSEPTKSSALLESKIQGLEASLKQREELIEKLNKEIEEIKDPLKMNVISGIKDNQVEGLKANLARMQAESEAAQKREKDLLGVVDKAVQLKEETLKKLKEYEAKLRQVQDGNNSKVVTLEKQLEEQKRQNKELLSKLTQATDQKNKAA